MEMPEQIWFLMSRNLSGEASAEEQQELSQQLQEHPQWQQQYETLRQLWKMAQEEKAGPEPAKINRILQLAAVEETLQQELPPAPVVSIKRNRKWFRYAAAILIVVLGVGALFTFVFNKKAADVIVAQKGTKSRTILPDGSIVWLNADSRIEFNSFTGSCREVTLHGEAYFDVIKQPGRPFIVHAGGIDIKVLGTAFNVKSYPGEDSVETTLIRGLVQLTRTGDKKHQPIYLHPNQKIVLPVIDAPAEITEEKKLTRAANPSSIPVSINYLDTTLKENERFETAWMYNRLEFRGDNFLQLAKKMERWYNITIHFEDEEAKNLMFNGSIENENVEQAFKALQTAVPFNYKIDQNEIYVSSR